MKIKFNIEKSEFELNYLYKKPFLFKSAAEDIDFSWDYVNEVYSRADVSDEKFKLMSGYEVPKNKYVETYDNLGKTEFRMVRPVLYDYLRDGATLVYNRITNEPKIDRISKQIANFANAHVVTSGYAAFSSKSSYMAHWDTRDVFAVQLIGRKRWILKAPNFELPLYMQQTKNFKNIKEPEEVYMDVVLEAGDILYVPRGWWHNPLPIGEETFHLAVGTFAPTGFEYMNWLLKHTPNILGCRRNFSSFDKDKQTLREISEDFSKILNDQSYYEEFLTQHIGNQRLPTQISLDILGNNSLNSLHIDTKVIVNTNLLYFSEENFVVINGNKITIDDISEKLVRFLFERAIVSVKDILAEFNNYEKDKIDSLLFGLALNDVISIVK
ncbi:JmjC domain-containing protein [Psychrobacter sp. TWR1-1-1]|uniref:JmjC domain-containing protein n=1 Tax=Psychrobacter sp. TWR1-1-1 TaxID=2804665 RepID=UPI003CF6564E